MKTTIDLPDDLVREAKMRALMQGRTLRDLIADYIRQGLDLSAPPSPAGSLSSSKIVVGPDGLPFIPCRPDAPAARMSIDELLELEQQVQAEEETRRAGGAV